ncbi:Crp/Fnr family transcriptional regulator [Gallaecimonas sp. GXIMD4217]|uniref:Crp/Fnr family transcriptional regulator n=1 Tax=Gallaecimonas sp. GXIMD4217 TaxID=3131927 RepID=UPI00311B2702
MATPFDDPGSHCRTLLLTPGQHLWSPGDRPKFLAHVDQGLLKAVVTCDGGREYIKEFYWQGDCFLDVLGYLANEQADHAVVAVEPCRLRTLPLPAPDSHGPWLDALFRRQLLFKERKERLLLTLSPQQRYRHFCQEFPELQQRLPDYLIAAYLGITAISLSRIKGRLNKG